MADRTVVVRFVAQVSQARSQLNTLSRDYTQFGNTVATQSQRAGQSAQTLAQMSANAGKMILIGIGGALAVSAKAAIDFQSSFAGIRKTVDTSEAGFKRLEQDMRNLAKIIPVNVNELNRIGEVAGQLGIEADNIAGFTKTISMIGATTTLSVEQASIGFARLSNILQVPQNQIDRLGSVIVELGNNFATTEDQILNFALRVAPIGATVGLTADNVLALATAFSSVGVPAERGGTAVQRVFATMAEAVLEASDDLESFAKTAGMTADEFATLYGDDPAQAFNQFIIGLRGIIDNGGNAFAALRDVGISSQRTMQAVLGLAAAEDLLTEALNMSAEEMAANDALTEEFEKRMNTAAAQMQLAANAFYDLRIEIGEKLLPTITELIQTFTYLINAIGDVDGNVIKTIANWTTMLAVGGGLVAIGKKLVTGFKALGAALRVTGAIAGTLTGAFAALAAGWVALKIGGIIQDHIVWEQKVRALTDAYTDLARVQAEGRPDTSEQEQAIVDIVESLLDSDALKEFGKMGVTKGILMDYVFGDPTAIGFVRRQMADLNKEIGILHTKAAVLESDPLNADMDRLADILAEGAALQQQYDTIYTTIVAVTTAMDESEEASMKAAEAWTNYLISIGKFNQGEDIKDSWLRQAEGARKAAEETRKAAIEASNFWDIVNDESIQESIDLAGSYVDAIVSASQAYNDLKSSANPTIEQAQAFARAMADVGIAAEAAGEEGIEPLIAEYERMYRAGLLTREETDRFISDLYQLPTAADAYVTSLARMRLANVQFSTSIYQAALLALDFARIASFEGRLAGAATLFSGAVKSGGGAVKKTAQEIAHEAANAFLSTLQADLSYRQAQKALEGVKKAIEDLEKERVEVSKNINDLMVELAQARIEAAKISMDEQIDILRAQLDIFEREGDLADMRDELANIDEKLAENDEKLADALERYNSELERSIRLGVEHDQKMTDLQASLLKKIRDYGMGVGTFADIVDAEAALAAEIAAAGDAAAVAEQAEEDYANAQEEHARTREEILQREIELKLEIQLAELELIRAREELIQLQKDAIGPNQDVLDLEEQLKEAKERLVEIMDEQKDKVWELESAQYDLISAYMNLQTATSELAKNKDAQRYFQDVAREAGLAEQAVRDLMALIGTPQAQAAINPPPPSSTPTPPAPPPPPPVGPFYDPNAPGLEVFGNRPVLGDGGFIMTPRQHSFPAVLHGQEAVIPLDRLEKMLKVSTSSGGDTILVQLGNEEIATFMVDAVLDKASRQTRVARRVS